ncbi:Integrator complex subunit 4 [Orchesella cincta]|uniref:Integrator complex subunit 4 n=1 Tax=Orchesella cincta TaxID=48709 RepID=A0A1D2N3F7_ORCCI|nr:Integrator complex subunit 4 [Orchesella cincta]
MAARAPIKKRALAEFQSSHTITVDAEPAESRSVKRLRIIKKPAEDSTLEGTSAAAIEREIAALDSERPASENFRALSKIVAHLPLSSALMMMLHSKLITLFPKEEDSALKAKYLTTFQLLNLAHPELMSTIDEILRMVQNETSSLVINSSLTVVLKLASSVNDTVSNNRILGLAKKLVKRTDAKVKCKCLEIIGLLTPFDDSNAVKTALQLVHSYSHSHEPRVRTTAFKMMLHLNGKGANLDVQIYGEVSKYLDDDYESVKLASIQLLWAISQSYSDQ